MSLTKYASAEIADVLDLKGSKDRIYTASLNKMSEYNDFRTDDDFLYVRIRSISSRINQNHDGWPTVELAGSPDILAKHHSTDGFTLEASNGNQKYGFATFMNKPIFVDHNNGDPKKTRGMIVDSKFRVLDAKTADLDPYWSSREVDSSHLPACEIELLLEIDAKSYPKFANAVKLGHIDGFSMGCNCEFSTCSHCGNKAHTAAEFCSHVKLKGHEHDYKTASGQKIKKKSYENVGGVQFFEISGVFNPADETALTKEIIASGRDGGRWDNNYYNPVAEGQYDPNGPGIIHPDDRDKFAPHTQGIDGTYQEFEDPSYGQYNQGVPHLDEQGVQLPYFMKQNEEVDENGLPIGSPSPARPTPPGGIYDQELHGGPEAIPNQVTQNDPRWSHVHTSENELPQSMKVHAPDDIDTLRDEHICPICFAPGTLVRTENGYEPIEMIKMGTKVLTGDGHFHPVLNVMENKFTGNAIKIDSGLFTQPVIATPDHPFYTLAQTGDHHQKCAPGVCDKSQSFEENHHLHFQSASSLTNQNYLVHVGPSIVRDITTVSVPEQFRGNEYVDYSDIKPQIKMLREVDHLGWKRIGELTGVSRHIASQIYRGKIGIKSGSRTLGPTEFELTPDFLWAIGMYIAEGSNNKREINFALHRKETEYQDRLIRIFTELGYHPTLYTVPNKPNSIWVVVGSTVLARWFPAWIGKHSHNKIIPAELMLLPDNKIQYIIEGVLNGDGHDKKGNLKQTSRTLALQVAEYGNRINCYKPSITTTYPLNKKITYQVENAYKVNPNCDYSTKYGKNKWAFGGYNLSKISSIQEIPYDGYVYNLEVDVDHTYVVEGALVHNCGAQMEGETCDVCGFVQSPKDFDNPDLQKAQQIRDEMKTQEETAAGPQTQAPIGQMPNKQQPTANVNNRMSWTPLVTEKTAARINKVENPVLQPNTIVTNQPSNQVILNDQRTPITSAMLTAQRLMATAQRNHNHNHLGESMSNTKIADGATPPDGTSAKERIDVVGVGGFDEASNEAASTAQKQIDVTGIGGTGVEGVEPDKTETLTTADPKSDDSGFNTDKTTEDSGPTKTFGDSDGTAKGITDPVTSDPFPATEDGVKAANAYYAAVKQAQDAYAQARYSYDDNTLEQNEQQGNKPVAQGGSAVQGVQPTDSVATDSYKRVNLLEHQTTPANNSGPTTTWSGTDGNGVLKQQDPTTKDKMEFGGVPTPDVKLHTGSVRISSIKLAELEIELGLSPVDAKFNRIATLDNTDETVVLAQIESLSKVKTAGLAKIAQHRTAGLTKVPSMFGKFSSAPNGFTRVANDHTAASNAPMDDYVLDSAIFGR
jgi:hypothetical protein